MTEEQIITWVKENKKRLVAEIIGDAQPQKAPVAIIMAGIPGAGKTEFLTHAAAAFSDIVMIDLDDIASKIDGYQPKNYYKYRKAANILVSAVLDKTLKNKYNFALDGTFSHRQGAQNIERALRRDFMVGLFFVAQNPKLAWNLTQARRLETGRPIEREGFIAACRNVVPNIRTAISTFRDNKNFYAGVILKDGMKDSEFIDDLDKVDKVLADIYNIYTEDNII
jgi:predicted ABC-type ATPase